MPEISVNIEVFCATCGYGLCGETDVKHRRSGDSFEVAACSKCLENARDEGYAAGYQEGLKEIEDKEKN